MCDISWCLRATWARSGAVADAQSLAKRGESFAKAVGRR